MEEALLTLHPKPGLLPQCNILNTSRGGGAVGWSGTEKIVQAYIPDATHIPVLNHLTSEWKQLKYLIDTELTHLRISANLLFRSNIRKLYPPGLCLSNLATSFQASSDLSWLDQLIYHEKRPKAEKVNFFIEFRLQISWNSPSDCSAFRPKSIYYPQRNILTMSG